ncbi:MAG: acyltransferase family protein [Sphingomonas fennica]
MKHRGDIDGLRAVAVLPIVLFHAGVSALQGGFVGVDVFFVISGFLITAIITREMAADRLSIGDFYHRRIVRIFPALVVLLAAVLLIGTQRLLTGELVGLARSAAAAMAFVSNIFFWTNADYFAGAAEAKPLLHTWSLGVEEQFYLFYPWLLLVLRRLAPRHVGPAVLAITLLSFAASLIVTARMPTTAFYLLPTRAWELGIGALVALGLAPRLASPAAREAAATAGLVLIAAAILFVRAVAGFPAPYAALPCFGAALVIAYGAETRIGALLALPPLRWIGAVSYSLYLWHWPIITFYRLETGMALNGAETVALVALSLLAAAVSYYLVEQPCLRRWRQAPGRPVLVAGGAAVAAVAGAALLVDGGAAAIAQEPAAVARVAAYTDYRALPQYAYQFRKGPCFIGEGQAFDEAGCLRLDPARPDVLLLGDSHAAQYWRALALAFPHVNVMQATASGCRPVVRAEGAARCTELVDRVLRQAVRRPGTAGVVLAGRWQAGEADRLADTVRRLRRLGLPVTVIGPTVEYDGEMPQLLARAMLQQDMAGMAWLRTAGRDALDRRLARLVEGAGGTYLSEIAAECPAGRCRLLDREGGPYHFDYGHLTLAASRDIVARLPSITG